MEIIEILEYLQNFILEFTKTRYCFLILCLLVIFAIFRFIVVVIKEVVRRHE